MIKSFKHKGLKQFFETGSIARIGANHQNKLRLILADLDAAVTIEDMNAPAYSLHKLKGGIEIISAVSKSMGIGELLLNLLTVMLIF